MSSQMFMTGDLVCLTPEGLQNIRERSLVSTNLRELLEFIVSSRDPIIFYVIQRLTSYIARQPMAFYEYAIRPQNAAQYPINTFHVDAHHIQSYTPPTFIELPPQRRLTVRAQDA